MALRPRSTLDRAMNRSGLSSAVAGLALLLLAGPGTRMAWWTFRTGLGLLRYAAWSGMAGVVLAVLGIVLGLLFGGRVLVAGLALLVGLAAFVPPYLFQRAA